MSVVYPAPGNKNTIYVGGLDANIDEQKLHDAFIMFGEIKEVFIPRDRTIESTHHGFAFIEYFEAEDAKGAIDNMHMNEIYGQVIRCNMARPTRITTAGVHSVPIWELEAAAGSPMVEDNDGLTSPETNVEDTAESSSSNKL